MFLTTCVCCPVLLQSAMLPPFMTMLHSTAWRPPELLHQLPRVRVGYMLQLVRLCHKACALLDAFVGPYFHHGPLHPSNMCLPWKDSPHAACRPASMPY